MTNIQSLPKQRMKTLTISTIAALTVLATSLHSHAQTAVEIGGNVSNRVVIESPVTNSAIGNGSVANTNLGIEFRNTKFKAGGNVTNNVTARAPLTNTAVGQRSKASLNLGISSGTN